MTFLSPWGFVWLIAVASVIGLYLLKPRSRRMEVSSVWLWQGVLKEDSARSLLQWLRRHLLLLLQVLVALLGVFLLARPALSRSIPVGRTVVFAIDASEPMLANDGNPAVVGSGGPNSVTRLDEAKASAQRLLGQLEAGDRAVIVAMADRVQIAAQGSVPQDLQTLRTGINRIQVRPTELDLRHALQAMGGLTQTARVGEIILITGGVYDVEKVTYRPPVAIQVLSVGRGEGDNQAITHLSARRDPHSDLEVFVRVRNFGDQPATGALRFTVDGQPYHEQQITIPPQNNWESVLTEFPQDASLVQATFARSDLLLLDNVATAAVPVPVTRRVLLVNGRTEQLERALKAVPGVEVTKRDPQEYGPGGFDVYVFEGWFPPQPPPGHWLLVDPPSNGSTVFVSGVLGRRTEAGREINDTQIARILPSPLLTGVDLTGISIAEAKRIRLPEWAEEIVSARDAPLIFMGYPRPYRAAVFAFDLRFPNSNLLGRVGFPVLVANTLNWLTGEPVGPFGAEMNTFVPGEALPVQPLPRATHVQVETPDRRNYRFDGNSPVRFLNTVLPGAYTVTQFAGPDQIAKRVHIATVLQPGREAALADLKPRETAGHISTVSGPQAAPFLLLGPGAEPAHSEWWRYIGVLILVGLVVEWWWFHR
jgi:Ca-activated chloride channel homolog